MLKRTPVYIPKNTGASYATGPIDASVKVAKRGGPKNAIITHFGKDLPDETALDNSAPDKHDPKGRKRSSPSGVFVFICGVEAPSEVPDSAKDDGAWSATPTCMDAGL